MNKRRRRHFKRGRKADGCSLLKTFYCYLTMATIVMTVQYTSTGIVLALSSKSKSPIRKDTAPPPPRRRPPPPRRDHRQVSSLATSSSSSSSSSNKSLHTTLQKSFTPHSILEVANRINPKSDPTGSLSSLTLIRLSKQLIALDNIQSNIGDWGDTILNKEGLEKVDSMESGWTNVVSCLVGSDWIASSQSLESVVEGIKACSVISRIASNNQSVLSSSVRDTLWYPFIEKLHNEADVLVDHLQPHHLSGLKWSMDCFRLQQSSDCCGDKFQLPQIIQRAYDSLNLPFRIRPGVLTDNNQQDTIILSVPTFVDEVDFQVEQIITTSNRIVPERRQTSWQGDDDYVTPFEYSGKVMTRHPWSPTVRTIRDTLYDETSQYYDCCLLNLYNNGGSAMRYHIDPDQGILWGYETAVVSIGAARRFAFRSIDKGTTTPTTRPSELVDSIIDNSSSKPHTFVLMNGDVTEMFNNCQERYQHTVKVAENRDEVAPRVSLVFKKTLHRRPDDVAVR